MQLSLQTIMDDMWLLVVINFKQNRFGYILGAVLMNSEQQNWVN